MPVFHFLIEVTKRDDDCYLMYSLLLGPHRSSYSSTPAERFFGDENVILYSSEDFTFHLISDSLSAFAEYAMSSGFCDRRLTSPTRFEEWPSVVMSGGFLAHTYPLLFAPVVEHRFLIAKCERLFHRHVTLRNNVR